MVLKIRWGWAKTESFRRQTSPSKKMNQETADRVAEPNAKKEQTRRWISGRMSEAIRYHSQHNNTVSGGRPWHSLVFLTS